MNEEKQNTSFKDIEDLDNNIENEVLDEKPSKREKIIKIIKFILEKTEFPRFVFSGTIGVYNWITI